MEDRQDPDVPSLNYEVIVPDDIWVKAEADVSILILSLLIFMPFEISCSDASLAQKLISMETQKFNQIFSYMWFQAPSGGNSLTSISWNFLQVRVFLGSEADKLLLVTILVKSDKSFDPQLSKHFSKEFSKKYKGNIFFLVFWIFLHILFLSNALRQLRSHCLINTLLLIPLLP